MIRIAIRAECHNLPVIITGDAAHIVVHRRRYGQRFSRQINAGKNLAAFGDPRQPLTQHLGINVIQMQVDVVTVGAYAAAFAHFQRHRTADNVARCKVLSTWSVTLHEALAFAVCEVTTLAARALCDQHARAVNTGRVELYKLHILQRQAGAEDHAATIASAGVRRRRGEIAAAITTGCQHYGLRAETMDRAIIEAHCGHADAFPISALARHNQVKREIFDEEVRIILQALLIQRVKHGVAGTVSRSASTLHRRAFTHILHVAAKRALVNRAIFVAAEGHACMLQLVNRCWRFTSEIFNRVLITQPVCPLHCVIHMP